MRYFLDSDGDGHSYLVEEDHRDQWNTWCSLDEDDMEKWDVPYYATALRHAPSLISFVDPQRSY